MGEKKAFKKFPKKQHIKNDTPSVQERVEEVYDDGRVLLKEKPHRNGRYPFMEPEKLECMPCQCLRYFL